MNISAFFARLIPPLITPQAIRMEIFSLGGRHQGEALPGALMELKACVPGTGRSRLLRAVIGQLQRDQRSRAAPAV